MKRSLFPVFSLLFLMLIAPGCAKHQEAREIPVPVSSGEPVGEALFKERCRDCHLLHNEGGKLGPDLFDASQKKRSSEFIREVIREPAKVFPGTLMPGCSDLSARQVSSLVDLLGR